MMVLFRSGCWTRLVLWKFEILSISVASSLIDAIIFDWGGVITVPPGPVVTRLYGESGVNQSALKSRQAKYDAKDPNSRFAQLERGELALEDYLAWSRNDLEGAESIWDPESPYFLFPHLLVVPEVVSAIRDLQNRGFTTGLLSNNIAEAWPYVLSDLDVNGLFDISVNSAFVGMRKPEERIFTHILDELQLPAERVLFLDDVSANIDAAKSLGMKTLKVIDPVQSLSAMETILMQGT
mgnify:CR=1 FL=1|jgi:epoxide hydrolase-like predicted phosphatase